MSSSRSRWPSTTAAASGSPKPTTYPRRAPDGKGRDRILIFEDTDLNGTLDKRTVFYEGLNLVSGLEVGFGGVWVGAAPYLLFIPDKDGDDKPDGPAMGVKPRPGNNSGDCLSQGRAAGRGSLARRLGLRRHARNAQQLHLGARRLALRLPRRLHAQQSRQAGHAGRQARRRSTPASGAITPSRHEFEVFAHGTSNPWGLDYDQYGNFFATACVIPHLFHIIPGARYERQAGQHFNPYTYDDIKTIADHRHYTGNQWNDGNRRPVRHARRRPRPRRLHDLSGGPGPKNTAARSS